MFIQTEATPNPSTLKFIPGLVVLENGSLDFRSLEESRVSPLAERLFAVEGVAGVFLSQDFIAITKSDDKEWFLLKPALLGVIMEHFTAGRPVLNESDAASQAASASEGEGEADDEVVAQIKALLDTRVRPAVAMDGGDIVYHSFEEGVVYLSMRGACAGCPSSTATLKMGIENMLRHYIPEVQAVEPVELY
jgi:Fe-S cluster biogenesis protein NfuA